MPTALINNMHTINLRGVLTCHRTAVGQVSVYFVQRLAGMISSNIIYSSGVG